MKELKINVPNGYEIDKDKSTFENIVFKKKVLPKRWKDLGNINGYWVAFHCEIIEGYSRSNFGEQNIFKTKEQAEASLALAQLSQLRDVYRQGWVPDWTYGEVKYCIEFNDDEPCTLDLYYTSSFLSFQDQETAELFLENFRDLIKQAKPLMS